jgi:hypothetical protein
MGGAGESTLDKDASQDGSESPFENLSDDKSIGLFPYVS